MKFEYKGFTVIPVNEGIKLIKGNEEKTVKVIDTAEFRYRLTKSKIYAADGPSALVSWMNGLIEKDFGVCWVSKILNYAWDEMKEMRETK